VKPVDTQTKRKMGGGGIIGIYIFRRIFLSNY